MRVRERCVFTTHTPVAAGHDEFDADLIKAGFGDWYETALGLSLEEFLALGYESNGGYRSGPFGLTPLALRMSPLDKRRQPQAWRSVARALAQDVAGTQSVTEVPITSVTNGVHPPTWVAPPLQALYRKGLVRIGWK